MSFRTTFAGLVCLAATLTVPAFGQAEDYPYSLGLGLEFSSGTYGSGTRTHALYAPLTITASPTDRFGLLLEVPLVYQSNGNLLSGIDRAGMHTGKAMQMPAGGMSGMNGSSGAMTSGSVATRRPESGLGDIVLKAGYVLFPEQGAVPQVRPLVFVKFPTADRDKALGTGEFDAGGTVEVSKWFGDWNPFVEAGYTYQGRSPLFRLKDYLTYCAGTGYQVGDRFQPILLVKGATAPAEGASALLEVRLKLRWQASPRTGLEGYLAKGITTSSADYGTGFSVYYSF